MAGKKVAVDGEPITIKKYANRRLYNTATSSYVTLDHLCQMVKEGVEFVVYDAKSGEDITRPVLTQIIVEEEAKGQNLLPINFLRQLISYYGDNLQWVVPSYLEHMMSSFQTNQDRMRESMQQTFSGVFPFENLEEVSKKNMVLFNSAMKVFAPFADEASASNGTAAKPRSEAPAGDPGVTPEQETLVQLKQQVDLLQKQLETLAENKKKS